jgi:hypothetical protein
LLSVDDVIWGVSVELLAVALTDPTVFPPVQKKPTDPDCVPLSLIILACESVFVPCEKIILAPVPTLALYLNVVTVKYVAFAVPDGKLAGVARPRNMPVD